MQWTFSVAGNIRLRYRNHSYTKTGFLESVQRLSASSFKSNEFDCSIILVKIAISYTLEKFMQVAAPMQIKSAIVIIFKNIICHHMNTTRTTCFSNELWYNLHQKPDPISSQ